MLAGLGLVLLATGAGAAPVRHDLLRPSPCLQAGFPDCGTVLATDPAGALDGRMGMEIAPLPPVDPVSALLPRASRAVVAELTGRFRRIARLEAFLAFLAGDALSLDELAGGDPLLAATLQPSGTRAIAAFPGQAGGLFADVGGQVLRGPGASGSSRRAVAAPQYPVAPTFFLAALAGGAGGNGGGTASAGGATPAAALPGAALSDPSAPPGTALSGGLPTAGPGAIPGSIGPRPTSGRIGGDGAPTGGGGGGGGGSPGPAPVPLPLPGLLLACALCGLSLARARSI